jgi:hypothetical protein
MQANATILLVEDSEDDFLLFNRALRATGLPFHAKRVESCLEARDYLLGVGAFSNRAAYPFPKLIIAVRRSIPESSYAGCAGIPNAE